MLEPQRERPADAHEGGPRDTRPFGDLIGWQQILNYGQEKRVPVVFVTQDQKPDWWEKRLGETLGPHKALVAEYRGKSGAPFFMYDLQNFLTYSREQWNTTVADRTIAEVATSANEGSSVELSNVDSPKFKADEVLPSEDRPKARVPEVHPDAEPEPPATPIKEE